MTDNQTPETTRLGKIRSSLSKTKLNGSLIRWVCTAGLLLSLMTPTPALAGWGKDLLGVGVGVEGAELLMVEESAGNAARAVGTDAYQGMLEQLRLRIERHPDFGLPTAEHELKKFAALGDTNAFEARQVLTDLGVNPDEVLAGETAVAAPAYQEIATYGPMNPGPLPEGVATTFRSSTYTEVATDTPTILYRVYWSFGC